MSSTPATETRTGQPAPGTAFQHQKRAIRYETEAQSLREQLEEKTRLIREIREEHRSQISEYKEQIKELKQELAEYRKKVDSETEFYKKATLEMQRKHEAAQQQTLTETKHANQQTIQATKQHARTMTGLLLQSISGCAQAVEQATFRARALLPPAPPEMPKPRLAIQMELENQKAELKKQGQEVSSELFQQTLEIEDRKQQQTYFNKWVEKLQPVLANPETKKAHEANVRVVIAEVNKQVDEAKTALAASNTSTEPEDVKNALREKLSDAETKKTQLMDQLFVLERTAPPPASPAPSPPMSSSSSSSSSAASSVVISAMD